MCFLVIPAHEAVTTDEEVRVWDSLTIQLIYLVHM